MTEIELLEHVLGNRKAGKIAGHGLEDIYGRPCKAKDLYHIAKLNYLFLQIAPRTHIVNTFEVPAPEIKGLSNGDIYYTPCHTRRELYLTYYWRSETMDTNLLCNRQVFLTKEAAILNQKAQAGVDPYKGDDE